MKTIRWAALILCMVMLMASLPVGQASAAGVPELSISITTQPLKFEENAVVNWLVTIPSGTQSEIQELSGVLKYINWIYYDIEKVQNSSSPSDSYYQNENVNFADPYLSMTSEYFTLRAH